MSLFNQLHTLYGELPEWMINCAGSLYYAIPHSVRYGQVYSKTEAFLEKMKYATKEEIEAYQNEQFLNIVNQAYNHVPYYRKRWDEYGVNVSQIRDLRDIVMLPTMDKADLREAGTDLISDKYQQSDLMYITTSGSTGNPVGFYQKKDMLMIEWAYTMDIWKRVGCTPESKRLVLRKKKIHPNKKDPHYFYDSLRRELSVDIFDMSDENMERYCQAIEYYKPEFVHGYTSAIVMLARFVERRPGGLKHQFKALLATSETIFPEQKKYVEMVFGCRMFSFYGHSERLVIAGSCEAGDAYHVEPTYGYCELLDENGQQADCGEMVTTGFLNDAMPLIRYRTKDLAEWDLDDTCACGRNSRRLKRVYGRVNQDMLVTDEGTVIAPNIYSSEIGNVICYKLIQNQPGIVTMQVVPGEGYDDQCAQNIKNTLEKRVSGHIRFDVVAVQHIPVLENGKHRVVEQHLSCGKL